MPDIMGTFFKKINRRVEWHRLPAPLAVLNLKSLRDELRRENLYDTYEGRVPGPAKTRAKTAGTKARQPAMAEPGTPTPLDHRTADGSGYDPADASLGRVDTRFGRNAPLKWTKPRDVPGLPSPREVSRRLLARRSFIPAPTLNMLAAAWIQFQVHDWFSHGPNQVEEPIEIALAEGDDWPEDPMRVRRTAPGDVPGKRLNKATHWWDGSQIYGSSPERSQELRSGEDGKFAMEEGLLPNETDPVLDGIDLTGLSDNYWLGLSLLHTIFVKEHNAICDMLRGHHPTWDDERLFQKARLINSALMAKIHTVEWTPGILNTPTLHRAMNTNWYGMLGRRFKRTFGRVGKGDVLSGIPGSRTVDHGTPYAITEEFTSVYRLHPLIPDEYRIRSHETGDVRGELDFTGVQGHATRSVTREYGMTDLLYTFGVDNCGAITLHNHPAGLGDLTRLTGERVDVGTIDVLRDRERGVACYNDFREMLHKPRIERWEDLTPNQKWVREIRDVYEGDLDKIDLIVGLCAEKAPKGFGFSDTAFRVFILMASRRLNCDPFLSEQFTPEMYTPEGLEWIENYTMLDVLRRHHPELTPALSGMTNAFSPWRAVR